MGIGIAAAFAHAGARVDLVDIKERSDTDAARARCAHELESQLDLLVDSTAITARQRAELDARLSLAFDSEGADAAVSAATAIVEAVPELIDIKQAAFARIGAAASPDALVMSTTSSFLVDTLAALVPHPERFLNTHWLNPAFLMPLVEVSPGEHTDRSALDGALALLRRAGKVPVTTAASPGYIVPRLQTLIMNEATRMVEEGVASADDIDIASRVGFGLRFAVLGVIEFIDWGGLDTLLRAGRYFTSEIDDQRFEPPEILADHVAHGWTGMTAGRGLRELDPDTADAILRERTATFVALLRHLGLLPSPPA